MKLSTPHTLNGVKLIDLMHSPLHCLHILDLFDKQYVYLNNKLYHKIKHIVDERSGTFIGENYQLRI